MTPNQQRQASERQYITLHSGDVRMAGDEYKTKWSALYRNATWYPITNRIGSPLYTTSDIFENEYRRPIPSAEAAADAAQDR